LRPVAQCSEALRRLPDVCSSLLTEEETRFSKNLSNVEGTETDSVKLICEVSKPGAEVTWYKGDEELPEGGRYEHIVDGKRRILLVQDLKMSDAGDYHCKLSPGIKTSGSLKINGEHRSLPREQLMFHTDYKEKKLHIL